MNKKLSKEELDELIALATQPSNEKETGPTPDNIGDLQEFVNDINMVPGKDELSTKILWDYYHDWTKLRPNKRRFREWMSMHFERISKQRPTGTYYLIDEVSLNLTKDEMKRQIGLRLHEKRKIKRQK